MENKRAVGLDLYRILLAIMVVIVHSCTESTGGALKNVQLNTGPYFTGWILFAIAIPAVNSYALLSGYLSFGHRHSYRKIINIWLELLFYSVSITMIGAGFISLSRNNILLSFAPLTSGAWWYISAYIITSLIMPALDHVVRESTWESYKKGTAVLFVFICVGNAICLHKDVWLLNDGYSPFWISFLYVIGAGIKKYDLTKRFSHRMWGIMWLISILATASSRFFIENVTVLVLKQQLGGGLFYHYLSITVVASAVCSFCFFSTFKKEIRGRKVISYLAVGSFSSYIIHVHPVFLNSFLQERYLGYGAGENGISITLNIIFTAVVIVLLCAVIDGIRRLIFNGIDSMWISLKRRGRSEG